MKRSKLILILLVLSQISFGQYKSIFGESTTKWNLILFGACDAITTTPISVIGDSLINGNNYKKVDRWSLFDYSNGFLREDTIKGKVWFYNPTINKELLVMDLTLSKNDSFKIYTSSLDSSYIYVDTVFFKDDIKHILFRDSYIHICAPEETFEFIEGTGTNAGLFYTNEWNVNLFDSYLLCHEKDGKKIYGNLLFEDSCFFESVGIIDGKNDNEIVIFPNPTLEFVTFQFKNQTADNYDLKVYNSRTQLTHSISTKSNEIRISLNENSTGINYFILINKNRIINSGKIIKL
jgi:hypothetical protein